LQDRISSVHGLLSTTTVVEKDLRTARLRWSSSFIAVTNADTVAEDKGDAGAQAFVEAKSIAREAVPLMKALDKLIENASERKACAGRNYSKLLRRRSRSSRPGYGSKDSADLNGLLPTVDAIIELVQEYPSLCESTRACARVPDGNRVHALCGCNESDRGRVRVVSILATPHRGLITLVESQRLDRTK
jgi:hypothetical protein